MDTNPFHTKSDQPSPQDRPTLSSLYKNESDSETTTNSPDRTSNSTYDFQSAQSSFSTNDDVEDDGDKRNKIYDESGSLRRRSSISTNSIKRARIATTCVSDRTLSYTNKSESTEAQFIINDFGKKTKSQRRFATLLDNVSIFTKKRRRSAFALSNTGPTLTDVEQPIPDPEGENGAPAHTRTTLNDFEAIDDSERARKLTQDSFSFMMFAPFHSRCYKIATVVFGFQVVIFAILIADLSDIKNGKNPLGVPQNVDATVRVCQLIALIIATCTQEDARTSFSQLNDGFNDLKTYSPSKGEVTLKKYILSVGCRFSMGMLGLLATFLLIVTESSVLELLLNFTAIEFVSQLDDLAFMLAASGYFGPKSKDYSKDVAETEYTRHFTKKEGLQKAMRKPLLMYSVMTVMIISWASLSYKQSAGTYLCETIYVQFGDDFLPMLGAFSGLYERDGLGYEEIRSRELRESGIAANEDVGHARFTFCPKLKMWTFHVYDPGMFGSCENHNICDSNGKWLARSDETKSYDIASTQSSNWYVRKQTAGEGILTQMHIECIDCKYNEKEVCGDRGRCENNICACKNGWYGIHCDFLEPCPTIETDIDKDFLGMRKWSSTFSLLTKEPSESFVTSKKNSLVEVYNRPVYVNEFKYGHDIGFDVIAFTGRRWVLYYVDSKLVPNITRSNLVYALSEVFHAYWTNGLIAGFISEPMDVGTPKDDLTPIGLRWFSCNSKSQEARWSKLSVGPPTENVVQLICPICNNMTNPCFYDGVCEQVSRLNDTLTNRCKCSLGSSGSLCQVPPLNDGKCDTYFNTPQFSYDNGDCCESTCHSTDKYICGEGITGTTDSGLYAFGYVGYPHCVDPRFSSMLYGSPTLYHIIERGSLRCGVRERTGFFERTKNGEIGFEADFCRAIASAALNDTKAVTFVSTTGETRFNDLVDGKFDVLLLRTSVTAQRDVFIPDINTGVTFAASPYFFNGLAFGGIPPFGACADKLDYSSLQCRGLKICVYKHLSWYSVTKKLFPQNNIVAVVEKNYAEYLNAELCNSVAGESMFIHLSSLQNDGFKGSDYELGENIYSKEHHTAVTKQDDRFWSKFVSWVFEALIQAEQYNITKATSSMNGLAPTVLFGHEFGNMFQNAITAHGNYGEIYETNLERYIPRGSGMNNINDHGTGLLYSFPFGDLGVRGPDPETGGTIDKIRSRGTLNCGISDGSIGYAKQVETTADWVGFEVDICKAIAAVFFNGAINVKFLPLVPSTRFVALHEEKVDILVASCSHTLQREISEPTTKKGFDFSPTYLFDGMRFGGVHPNLECADRLVFDNTTLYPDCDKTKICAPQGTTWLDTMKTSLNIPEKNILPVASIDAMYDLLISNECNVIVGESIHVSEVLVRKYVFSGNVDLSDTDYNVGENTFTTERIAVASRSDDAQFSDMIRWLIFGLIYAAEEGIVKKRYDDMPSNVLLFGNHFSTMWQNLIRVGGNYNEIYDRYLEKLYGRLDQNLLNLERTPQFFANVGVERR